MYTALFLAILPSGVTHKLPSSDVAEALAYTVEGVYGQSVGFELKRDTWVAFREGEARLADTRIGGAIQGVMGLEMDLEQTIQPYIDLAGAVSLLSSYEPSYEWDAITIERSTLQLGDRTLTNIKGLNGNDVYTASSPGLHIYAPIDWPELLATDKAGLAGETRLETHVLAPMPFRSIPGGTWLETATWDASSGLSGASGNQRVILATPAAVAAATGESYTFVFERILGTMVPVFNSYVTEDDESWVVHAYSTVSHPVTGALVPFPRGFVEFEISEDSFELSRGTVELGIPPTSYDELRLPCRSDARLLPSEGVLTPLELSTFNALDFSSWPGRMQNLVVQTPG